MIIKVHTNMGPRKLSLRVTALKELQPLSALWCIYNRRCKCLPRDSTHVWTRRIIDRRTLSKTPRALRMTAVQNALLKSFYVVNRRWISKRFKCPRTTRKNPQDSCQMSMDATQCVLDLYISYNRYSVSATSVCWSVTRKGRVCQPVFIQTYVCIAV
jgi:hypothetical protein